MSSFGGLMVEYPQIAIDRFQGPAVLKARAYFLSHAHADHMVGLGSQQFSQRLNSSTHIKLYCSEVTREFLLTDRRFVHLEPFLISLPIEEPTLITLCDDTKEKDKQVLVSLLAAGHCPGSVMFLFEGDEGNVLYTGDFRFAKGEAARMELLHSGNSVKDIKSAYVDTTFCVPEAMYIPSRSKDALLDLVEQHIQKSPTHMVRLACKAKYGYEYLFVEISKEFNLKVHVSSLVMAQYERVPLLAKHLTTDGSTTQVHACRYMDCSMSNATDVLVVVPSTMWFTRNAQPSDVVRKIGRRYRLCFSFHSSFSEVRDFLSYIQPVNIYANVIPYRCTEEKINERLKDLKRGSKKSDVSESTSSYKPLGKLKVSARTVQRYNAAPCQFGSDITDELEALFNKTSPLVDRRKRIKLQENHHDGGFEADGDQQQRILMDTESSSSHSYIAMDDSDLSSCELDLFDSAPGQSQTHREDVKQPNHTSSESGDSVKSTNFPLHQTTKASTSSRTLTESSKPAEAETKFRSDTKLSGIKSKHNEISDWLRYLPNSLAVETQVLGKRNKSTMDGLFVDKTHEREVKNVDSLDMNSSLTTQPDNTERDKVRSKVSSKVRGQQSPNKKQTVESRLESHDEKQSIRNACHQDTKPDELSELTSSFAESDKTEEYKFSSSQELFPEEKVQDSSREEVQIQPGNCDSRTYQGILDVDDSGESKDKINDDSGFPTGSDSFRGNEALEHDYFRLNVASDPTQPSLHRNSSPLQSPNRINNLQSSDVHQIPSKSKEPLLPKTVTQSFADNIGQSLDTNYSGETFLPSSQSSLISQASSDFDIPCTPEGKKLHPSQVEEVRVMIARGDSIPLVSCKKKIESD
ncbi:protein artemis-like isoform X2 [Asterias rubens]|uniref:protein artemis-like isoform X2 n=1 Tax=Asterias rubens TaxID=7604 RepID=UPI0014557AE4|nr:protein artemis-like isoform X2 [Asterias rubens]